VSALRVICIMSFRVRKTQNIVHKNRYRPCPNKRVRIGKLSLYRGHESKKTMANVFISFASLYQTISDFVENLPYFLFLLASLTPKYRKKHQKKRKF
jgi:hypothetical protein